MLFQINGQSVILPHSCFSWLSYIKALLQFNDTSKETVLQASGYYPDEADMDCQFAYDMPINKGYSTRSAPYRVSKAVELCGPLVSDLLFNSSGALMPGCDYFIRMFRQPHSFCLMSPEADAGYKLKVIFSSLSVFILL